MQSRTKPLTVASSGDEDDPDPRLDEAAVTAIVLHHQQRAKLFLEAAIGAMIDAFGCHQTIVILQGSVEHLKDHG